VRHNNEEGGQSQYGPGVSRNNRLPPGCQWLTKFQAWEFKHPDFKANNKDALDNIRRKAPVPRKPNQASDEPAPTPHMDMVNGQLVATQQQMEALQQRYNELSMHHGMIFQELVSLQKTVVNHEHIIQNVMSYLHTIDNQRRRESKTGDPFQQQNQHTPGQQMQQEEEPPSPLAHADRLLSELNADTVLNSKNLEHMNEISMRMHPQSTPPPLGLRPGSRGPHSTTPSSATMRYNDLDNMVYPIGQNNGIDPMYSAHINNIPYPMPITKVEPSDVPTAPGVQPRKKFVIDPGWVRQPRILLVEDDMTCRRIGGKFLATFSCGVENAVSNSLAHKDVMLTNYSRLTASSL
jgi:osomolarity two-component system response regulator SKN7